MKCELCGSEGASLIVAVEGASLNLCSRCSKYGRVTGKIKQIVEKPAEKTKLPKEPEMELIEAVVGDYAKRIKDKRESLGLKQEDFARQISEKVSLIHKIETGHIEPSIPLAKKIEKFLKIKLVEELEEGQVNLPSRKGESLTIGDILKTKK